jgi:hypothetical protein
MGRAARDIDHVMLIPRDLAHARSAYERMGFTVTPLTSHPHGTANHLIMFQRDFIELLGVVAPERLVTHPQENGVPYERTSQAVRVLPDSAHGAVLEFTV